MRLNRHPLCTLLAICAALAGCALPAALPLQQAAAPTAPTPAPTADALLAPPPALLLQGLPPVPQRLADSVARYTDFAGHGLYDWHPTRRELLVGHRPAGGHVTQLYRLSGPQATPEALTSGNEPVASASYEPRQGRYVLLGRASGGNEVYQLYRLDPATLSQTLLTDPDQRHEFNAWLKRDSQLLFTSVPLDRSAQGGRRAELVTTLSRMDPLQPQARQTVAELPGGGWQVGAVSADDHQAALIRYVSATESELWLLDLASGQRRQLLPQAGAAAATYQPQAFSPDGRHLWLSSSQGGEFNRLLRLTLAAPAADTGDAAGTLTPLRDAPPWDVDNVEPSADGRLLALRLNVDGRDELRLVDTATMSLRALPAGLPAGSVGALHFHPQRNELAFSVNSARGPSQLWTLDLASGRSEAWTTPRLHPELAPERFTEQQLVRWTSFDGRRISGLLSRPPARFSGRRPVLINIHGGPEGQAKVGFLGRSNHLLHELGIAIIQPNVRGSSGYGKTFLALDNGRLREDSVKDIGALLDWIASQPDLDPNRVAVTGGSYGGYMSLAVATTYADRIASAVDVVGISHFVTFLQTTETYRRDLRRVEYGDEREPAMREFLHRISPLTNAHKITKPLFVVQGKNDPRVPYTEAEQIVAQVRANGTPVWYLRAENEGHGFARKENADYQFYATLLFLQQTLLGER